jgi:integrase
LLFPNRNKPLEPMSDAAINKVIAILGYKGRLTGHGFRHTMSTILHDNNFESGWIELQLAHVDKNTVRGTYNHAQYLSQRQVICCSGMQIIFKMVFFMNVFVFAQVL